MTGSVPLPRHLLGWLHCHSLVGEHRLGIAVDRLSVPIGGHIVRLPGRDHEADRQAFGVGAGVDFAREAAARTAETFASVPLFRPLPDDGRGSRSHRSSAPSSSRPRFPRALRASRPRCRCRPTAGIAERPSSTCRIPPASRAMVRRFASTRTPRPARADGHSAGRRAVHKRLEIRPFLIAHQSANQGCSPAMSRP